MAHGACQNYPPRQRSKRDSSVTQRSDPPGPARFTGFMAVGLLLQVPTLSADPAAATESYIRTQMREQGIPGVALGVVRHGRPLYLRGFGVATLEHAVPVRPQTRFQIGSNGKPMPAGRAMRLAPGRA